MTDDETALRDLLEKGSDATFLREMIGFAAERLMELEVGERTAACNGRHRIEQRLARWLLMAHDRVESDTFPMTHEALGMMLGTRRPGITLAMGTLQRAGLIRHGGGQVTVTDRPGLEGASCECYGIVRRAYDRALPADAGEGHG